MDLFAKKALIKSLGEKGIVLADIEAFHYANASTPHSTYICKAKREDYYMYINCMFGYPQRDIVKLLTNDINEAFENFDVDIEDEEVLIDLCEYQLEDKLRLEEKIGFSFKQDLYDFVDSFFLDRNNDVIDFLKIIEGVDTSDFFVRY